MALLTDLKIQSKKTSGCVPFQLDGIILESLTENKFNGAGYREIGISLYVIFCGGDWLCRCYLALPRVVGV